MKGKVDLTVQEIRQLKNQRKELNNSSAINAKVLEKSENLIAKLIQKRQSGFGEDDPHEFKNQFQLKLENTEFQLIEANTLWNEIKLELKANTTQIQETQKQLDKLNSEAEKLNATLQKSVVKSGFEGLEELKSAILTEAEAKAIQTKSDQLQTKSLKTQQDFQTTSKDLKKEQAKQLSDQDQSTIETELAEFETAFQEIQQEIGAINEKLAQNEKLKAESKILLQNIEKQRKEYNRWAKLNDIIGMADGKKFRVFAQGLTLKKLANLANSHLQQLNGRYFIHKRSDEDLALDIIDTFQADNIRSMNTLSGGESFLVSLALALGLSDLAGRNTTINSLFIDEGFGTLDDSTLDMAISTLENLQSKGKTIGVISHVKELKERISTQIVIKKKASGFSEIEITG